MSGKGVCIHVEAQHRNLVICSLVREEKRPTSFHSSESRSTLELKSPKMWSLSLECFGVLSLDNCLGLY